MEKKRIADAARILREAKHPLFLSGAGISAESGIPTFRGAEGLWKSFRAEELATPEAFRRDRALVWEWYNWRKRLISEKQPNPAHHAMVRIASKLPSLLSVTQNVDGFHALAGLSGILEMHGNIFRARCTACNSVFEMRGDVTPDTPCSGPVLSSPNGRIEGCGRNELRPDIVWFGEQLPGEVLDKIYERLRVCDAILVVGTSGQVYPAAGFAVEVRRREGHVIEINIEDGHKAYARDVYIRGKAGDILPQIADLL